MQESKMKENSFNKALDGLIFHLNDPPKSNSNKINEYLEILCKRKVVLEIHPQKCFLCSKDDISQRNSLSFPCNCWQTCHRSCLHDKFLSISPNLAETEIDCPKCHATKISMDKIFSCFQPSEIQEYKRNRICQICKKSIDVEKEKNEIISCHCLQKFHKSCVKSSALNLLKTSIAQTQLLQNTNLDEEKQMFICRSCNKPLEYENILTAFSEKEKNNMLENKENKKAIKALMEQDLMERKLAAQNKSFDCGICGENKNVEKDSITLDCDHRYCKECVSGYATALIDESKCSDDQLACPECKTPLGFHIVKGCLNEEKFQKYQNFLLQNGSNVILNEERAKCPNAKCGYFFFMPKNSLIVHTICNGCNQEFCVKGCPRPHKGTTCEEMKKVFEEEEKKNGGVGEIKIVNCPNCKVPITKSTGCNHMTCTLCKTSFCYICGEKDYKACGHQYVGYNRCFIF